MIIEATPAVTVGTILSASWGYEQTNVNFYEVVAMTKSMVTLQEIGKEMTETGNMSGTCVPVREAKIGQTFRRKFNQWGGVRVNDFMHASPWDGRPERYSSYA